MSYQPNTYFIRTFGCQANKSDSERIGADYHARGFTEVSQWQQASQIVINSCAVRQSAEERAKAFVRKIIQHAKDTGSEKPKIIFTGCMTHHGVDKLKQMMPDIDEFLPVNEVGFNLQAIRKDRRHAWVPISQGCNSFCSFCIVPYARGREQSRSLDSILTEIENLIEAGYQEITLLGQNVNSWGLEKVGIGFRKLMLSKADFSSSDLPNNQSQYLKPSGIPPFVNLLQQVSRYAEIKTIRFMTSNPWDFHDELIEEIGHNKKIDRYIHLPIQSGSNSVLKRMNRGYSKENYQLIVDKLRRLDKNIQIGTDIIVGFPQETEQEFAETLEFAQHIHWQVAFIAMYSPRPGTASYRLYADDVPYTVKKKRWQILDQLINKSQLSTRPKIV